MNKPVKEVFKIIVPAGQASPSPPLGPAFGMRKMKAPLICSELNEAMKDMETGAPVTVTFTLYDDNTHTFVCSQPSVSYLLKKVVGIDKGSSSPGRIPVGNITLSQLSEVAQKKMPDLDVDTVEQACKVIAGSAKSLGIRVVSD